MRVRTHLLLSPLVLPEPDAVRTDLAALRNAANLYDQLIGKGHSPEKAEQLCRVARLNGAPMTYSQPGDAA